MRTLKTSQTGIPIIVNGRFVFLEGAEATRQAIDQNLLFFKGSWPMDRSIGFDISFMGGKGKLADTKARSSLSSTLKSIPGVAGINSLQTSIDSASRTWNVQYSVYYMGANNE